MLNHTAAPSVAIESAVALPTLPPAHWLPRRVRWGGIAIGALMVVLCLAVVWWGDGRFAAVPSASQNLVFYRAGLFLVHSLALLFGLTGLAVAAVSASAAGKRRGVALAVLGLAGMILCVALRHLVVDFFLPWYELRRLVVYLPPALLWILNQHRPWPGQARRFGLLRALAAGMALALAAPALIIRAEGLLNTWRLPHLFATSHHGLIGLRILLIASLVAGAAIAAMAGMAMTDEWRGGAGHVRRWTNWCFVILIVAVLVSVAARTLYFDDRQLDDLLTRWIFTACWLLLALGGAEWAATVWSQPMSAAASGPPLDQAEMLHGS